MSEDIICLSSDDEFESPPPKRIKSTVVDVDVIKKLNNLKEINLQKYEDNKIVVKQTTVEENNLTIIIESDRKSKENSNNVVNLTDEDEPFDDIVPPTLNKTINMSGEYLIVNSDSETENNVTKESIKVVENYEDFTKDRENSQESSSKNRDIFEESIEDPPSEKQNGNVEANQPPLIIQKRENVIEPDENGSSSVIKKSEDVPVFGNGDILNRPSTSKATEAHKLLDEFLETCAKSLKCSKYESRVLPKFVKMKKNFEKCDNIHREPNFMKMLQGFTNTAKISAPEAVVSFQRIYSYLLDNINGAGIEVSEDELAKLKKLEKTCRILVKRIRKLEEAEINFDDEEDSTYIQIDKYSKRLCTVYEKYCKLLKKSPFSGRLLYERIQFVSSKYNEINRAITKSCKRNKFPTYYSIESVIRKCNEEKNLGLNQNEIKSESKHCFTSLGKLLQMRRKKELYEVHCGFITLNEDPASKDEELSNKLQTSLEEGDKKLKDLIEKYVKLQEDNVNPELSEDSDNSNYKDSESENED